MTRSASLVSNPALRLSHAGRIKALPPEAREALRLVLLDLRADAAVTAEKSWRKHKGPMAAYWKAVSVYAGHFARLCRG